MYKSKLKKDKYSKARGGTSKLLDIICTNCKSHVCYYQKDGPGLLKRMYLDRITEYSCENKKNFDCLTCGKILGAKIIYEKENRFAYRLFVGSVSKKTVKN